VEIGMKNEMYFYSVTPRLININKKTQITVTPLDPRYNFQSDIEYTVEILPLTRNARNFNATSDNKVTVKGSGNKLVFDYTFDKEEEYYLRIFKTENHERIAQLSVYALKDDLYNRRPLKGDLHIHSCRSDGRESPCIVAANYRSKGFDFFGLTDHYRYAPSIEVIDGYKDIDKGFLLFKGEEVHTPDNFVHIVHFGGESSVNEIFQKDEALYRREVDEILSSETIPYDGDKFLYAAGLWVSRKIKEAGGIGIFAHPHWISNVYNVPDDLTHAFLTNGVFDAFELIGGSSAHENNMQTAFYYQLCSEGYKIPIVSSSDSHGTINSEAFNKMYTIVFADEFTEDGILRSVKDFYSAAVEVYRDSVNYTVHGDYRLVAYSRFLIEHYFAFTAEFCAEDGLLMRQYLLESTSLGYEGARERLNQVADRSANFYKLCAGK
jgi:hypothetical protein